MSLIHCMECNNQISDKAKCCPYCGCPVETGTTKTKKISPSKWILAILMAVFVLVVAFTQYMPNQLSDEEYQKTLNMLAVNLSFIECNVASVNIELLNRYIKDPIKYQEDWERYYDSSEYESTLSSILEDEKECKDYMKKLRNPRDRFKEAYTIMSKCWGTLESKIPLATNKWSDYDSFIEAEKKASDASIYSSVIWDYVKY